MCLYYDKDASQDFVRKNRNKQFVWMYKKVYHHSDVLVSPVYSYQWQPGINKSLSRNKYKPNRRSDCRINVGIHVYCKLQTALNSFTCYQHKTKYLRVRCYLKDFIGMGCREAVFTKVYLSKTEYNKAIV